MTMVNFIITRITTITLIIIVIIITIKIVIFLYITGRQRLESRRLVHGIDEKGP